MNQTQLFIASLDQHDRLAVMRATTESKLLARYHENKQRLPGGNMLGGTETEGINMLREARDFIQRAAGFTMPNEEPTIS